MTFTDSEYVDRLIVTNKVSYDIGCIQVLQDLEIKDIMWSHYNAARYKVLYLIKLKGDSEGSKWTEEPLAHLPCALVVAFQASHPGVAIDAGLRRLARGI